MKCEFTQSTRIIKSNDRIRINANNQIVYCATYSNSGRTSYKMKKKRRAIHAKHTIKSAHSQRKKKEIYKNKKKTNRIEIVKTNHTANTRAQL